MKGKTMVLATEKFNLKKVTLKTGGGAREDKEVCILEAAAWMAGERHSDHPKCVSPFLTEFGINLNDSLNNKKHLQQLKQVVPLLIGTKNGETDNARYLHLMSVLGRRYLYRLFKKQRFNVDGVIQLETYEPDDPDEIDLSKIEPWLPKSQKTKLVADILEAAYRFGEFQSMKLQVNKPAWANDLNDLASAMGELFAELVNHKVASIKEVVKDFQEICEFASSGK